MDQVRPYRFRCAACGTQNRVPVDKAGAVGKCGRCGAKLQTAELLAAQPMMISDANFETQVMRSPLPVLMDCWASWCSACAMVGPVIEEVARDWKGRVRVCKLNVEANPMLAARYDLRSLPTLLVFDGGRLKDTILGAVPKVHLIQRMAPYL